MHALEVLQHPTMNYPGYDAAYRLGHSRARIAMSPASHDEDKGRKM